MKRLVLFFVVCCFFSAGCVPKNITLKNVDIHFLGEKVIADVTVDRLTRTMNIQGQEIGFSVTLDDIIIDIYHSQGTDDIQPYISIVGDEKKPVVTKIGFRPRGDEIPAL